MTDLDREIEDLNAAMRSVLATPDGKRVMFWLLSEAAIYRDAFSGDAGATNYVLGQQSVGRKIIQKMDELDPRTYPKLLIDVADMKAMERAIAHKEEEDDA